MASLVNSTNIKQDLMPTHLKIFPQNWPDKMAWYQSQTKTLQEKKLQANNPDKYKCKNPQQQHPKNQQVKFKNSTLRGSWTIIKVDLPPIDLSLMQGWYHMSISMNRMHHINRMKDKNYIIISREVGFPDGSAVKESACKAGNLGLISGLGRSLEKGKSTRLTILAWKIPWAV